MHLRDRNGCLVLGDDEHDDDNDGDDDPNDGNDGDDDHEDVAGDG